VPNCPVSVNERLCITGLQITTFLTVNCATFSPKRIWKLTCSSSASRYCKYRPRAEQQNSGIHRRLIDTEKAGGRYKLQTSVYHLRSNPCSSVRTLRYVYNWLQRRLLGNGGCRATVREKTRTSVMPTAFKQCARFRAVAVGISRNCRQGRNRKFILEGVFSPFLPFLPSLFPAKWPLKSS